MLEEPRLAVSGTSGPREQVNECPRVEVSERGTAGGSGGSRLSDFFSCCGHES